MPASRLGLPDLVIGVGLRTVYYQHLLTEQPVVDFLEIISDNYVESPGRPIEVLDRLAARYPIVMHGISLSIGSDDALDRTYLRQLVRLRDRTNARWVSDHLCFTCVAGRNTHDLLPLPYTPATLTHVADRIDQVQQALGAPLVIENPSTYVAWQQSTLTEIGVPRCALRPYRLRPNGVQLVGHVVPGLDPVDPGSADLLLGPENVSPNKGVKCTRKPARPELVLGAPRGRPPVRGLN